MIILNPLYSLVFFVGVAIDVTVFFLVIHFITILKPDNFLCSFDRIGSPLVHRVTAVTNRIVVTMFRRPPSEQANVLVSGLVLLLAKSALVLLLNALMGGQTSVRWVV